MSAFAPDTSVIVAILCSWHEQHPWAHSELTRRLDEGAEMVLAAHGLVESYAVLTRLPPPHRIAPGVAADLLDRSFSGVGRLVGLPPRAVWSLIRRAPGLGIAGGRTYDALIAESVRRGKAEELLTLNPAHFGALVGEDVKVVSP